MNLPAGRIGTFLLVNEPRSVDTSQNVLLIPEMLSVSYRYVTLDSGKSGSRHDNSVLLVAYSILGIGSVKNRLSTETMEEIMEQW